MREEWQSANMRSSSRSRRASATNGVGLFAAGIRRELRMLAASTDTTMDSLSAGIDHILAEHKANRS